MNRQLFEPRAGAVGISEAHSRPWTDSLTEDSTMKLYFFKIKNQHVRVIFSPPDRNFVHHDKKTS